jgi:hypothetical protein
LTARTSQESVPPLLAGRSPAAKAVMLRIMVEGPATGGEW